MFETDSTRINWFYALGMQLSICRTFDILHNFLWNSACNKDQQMSQQYRNQYQPYKAAASHLHNLHTFWSRLNSDWKPRTVVLLMRAGRLRLVPASVSSVHCSLSRPCSSLQKNNNTRRWEHKQLYRSRRLVSCHTGLTYEWLFLPSAAPPMRTGSECLHKSGALLKSCNLIMLKMKLLRNNRCGYRNKADELQYNHEDKLTFTFII